jgi:sugar-specific transcriptional regulator TrmB
MELVQSLKNLGLNEKEAKVYVALLQTGKATAYSVAKHSGLKKPTTYVILEDLIDKGIVSKVPRVKTAQYVVISPEDLFSMVKGKLENAEKEALPELKALSRGKEYKVRSTYYEGLDGIKEMYDKFLKGAEGKEYVAFYAHERDASPELIKFFDEYNEKHRKMQIRRRGITVHDKTIIDKFLKPEVLRKYNMRIKSLPIEKYDSNISIEVFKNLTQIFSHRHLQATVIDNPDVAKAMKQIFELVWECENFKEIDRKRKTRYT